MSHPPALPNLVTDRASSRSAEFESRHRWPPTPHGSSTRDDHGRLRKSLVLAGLALAALASMVVALGLGPVSLTPADVATVLREAATGSTSTVPGAAVVTDLRLPRVLLAALAGAGLAVAGAAMQAWFRNPLADPGVTGVASGAAAGAVVVLVAGITTFGSLTLPLAAFAGALGVLVVIQLVALMARDTSPITVLLIGIALNAFCGAATAAIVANAEDSQTVRGAMFWLQGDLTAASWDDLRVAAVPVLLGVLLLLACARELNALLLGDDTALSMGVSVPRLRLTVLVLTSVVVGAVVAVTGVIGFVGLVAPHVVRLLLGTDHRLLLPASALLGAAFLVSADTVARTAPADTAWQTGVVTALVGSPLFLALVLRSRHTAGRAA